MEHFSQRENNTTKKPMKAKIIISLLILLSVGCQTQKKWQKKGYEKGWLKDSVILEAKTTKGSKTIELDTNAIKNALDSLASMYMAMLDSCDNIKTPNGLISIKDSTKKEFVKKAIKQKIKEELLKIPCIFEPIHDSTQRYDLKIWVSNGKINYNLSIPKEVVSIKEKTNISWWHNFLEHYSIGVLSCIIFIFAIKKYT